MLGAVRVSVESLTDLVNMIARQYNVDPNLVKAVILQESNWDVNASRYETHLNDSSWGLMQVLLKTARWILGNDKLTISDLVKPETNIAAGTKYIGFLLAKYRNMEDAIASYNAGSPRRDKYGKYVNQSYVDSVMKKYTMYQMLGPTATAVAKVTSNPLMLGALGIAGIAGLVLVMEN